MDTSIISIESRAKEFGETLFERGFSKGILMEFKHYQATEVLLAEKAIMGIVLNGELLFQFQDCLVTNEVGDQFFIPANTYYQVTAGQQGAQFLFAVPKKYQETEESF
jgi:ethanolamine utilization protein EutQ (cupin superfamily)